MIYFSVLPKTFIKWLNNKFQITLFSNKMLGKTINMLEVKCLEHAHCNLATLGLLARDVGMHSIQCHMLGRTMSEHESTHINISYVRKLK